MNCPLCGNQLVKLGEEYTVKDHFGCQNLDCFVYSANAYRHRDGWKKFKKQITAAAERLAKFSKHSPAKGAKA